MIAPSVGQYRGLSSQWDRVHDNLCHVKVAQSPQLRPRSCMCWVYDRFNVGRLKSMVLILCVLVRLVIDAVCRVFGYFDVVICHVSRTRDFSMMPNTFFLWSIRRQRVSYRIAQKNCVPFGYRGMMNGVMRTYRCTQRGLNRTDTSCGIAHLHSIPPRGWLVCFRQVAATPVVAHPN